MALELKIDICKSSDCKSLIMSELTSTYLLDYNEGGYGSYNPDTTDVTAAELQVVTPSNTYVIELLNNGYGFPCDNPLFKWEIPFELLGITTETIPDGYYTFTYKVTAGGTDYEVTVNRYFHCKIDECFNSLTAKINIENCDCCSDSTEEYRKYIKVWSFLEALKLAVKCGDTTKFNKIKKILDKLCLNSKCKTC